MNNMENNASSGSNVHYKLPFKFGLGGVPLGNEFAVVTDKDAYAILDAAWSAGIRYYDVSPWYGLGLAERRFGSFLHNKKRSEYVISSKVGKLLKASKTARNRELFSFSPSPNDVIFDYTAAATRRSVEDSLQRLGIDSLDVVFVHDISPDNKLLPTSWQEQFDIAAKGAFPELPFPLPPAGGGEGERQGRVGMMGGGGHAKVLGFPVRLEPIGQILGAAE